LDCIAFGELDRNQSGAPNDKDVLTVEFKQNLLAPAVGDALIAKGHVKRAGKTLTICTADAFAITESGEKLVATMLATIMNIPARD
jgi:acyl-coenzyme A thioesterase PaaI-like protein